MNYFLNNHKEYAFHNMYIKEEYISYGRNDLSRMTLTELNEELKRINTEIEKIQNELKDSKSEIPTYSLKEQEKTAILYRDKINKEIESRDEKKDNIKHDTDKNITNQRLHPIKKFKKKITDYKQKNEDDS